MVLALRIKTSLWEGFISCGIKEEVTKLSESEKFAGKKGVFCHTLT